MRVVSLLPSATEILHALGVGDFVVGVTFECDHPAGARTTARVVSTTTLPEGLTPAQIDAEVSRLVAAGEDLYHLDAGALADLDADLVVTQDLCAVCALDTSNVDEALAHLGCRAQVLSLDPRTVDDVLDSVLTVGGAVGRPREADALVASLRSRLGAVRAAVAGRPRPRVVVLEWTDPPYAPGHWIPEMVVAAGGEPVLGVAGERSVRTTWAQVADAEPDVVVVGPCGFDTTACAEQARAVLEHLPAGAAVWAVDSGGILVRPGPRLVDGVETLAAMLHGRVGEGSARASTSELPQSVGVNAVLVRAGSSSRPPGRRE